MRLAVLAACAIVGASACSSKSSSTSSSTGSGSAEVTPTAHVRKSRALDPHDSSVTARDYIGPEACGECHPDEHARWLQSLHRTMNQKATPATILGRTETVAYAGGTMAFDRDARTMTLARGDRTVRYRVTRTIGTRGLQEYVGIAEGSTEEVRLPFGWWPRRAGWYPQPYFDPWLDEAHFDPYAQVKDPWAERCPWCHSTYPFAQRIARASARPVGHGLELHFASKPANHPDRLRVDQQVTVGISCESCHLGGRAHADGAPIHFIPIGATPRPGAPRPTSFEAERKDPAIVNRVCAQCHSGPSPRFPDGSAARNSSEALDLAASSCTARCIDCHDPHRADARRDETRAVAACVRCHEAHADPVHAGTGHEHVTCLDCHMPRIVLGIDHHVRTHRIGSPTDRRMLGASAPNACNLCHLDRTLQWTATQLRADYQARLGRHTRWDDDHPAGELWLASTEPTLRLIAASAYARAPKSWLPSGADLLPLLDDRVAYVRAWGAFALEDLTGRRIAYDPRATPEVRRKQIEALGRVLRSRR